MAEQLGQFVGELLDFPTQPLPGPQGAEDAMSLADAAAGLYGLMARWYIAPRLFSWDAAAAALPGSQQQACVGSPMTGSSCGCPSPPSAMQTILPEAL